MKTADKSIQICERGAEKPQIVANTVGSRKLNNNLRVLLFFQMN